MIQPIGKASNVLSVLMNNEVVKQVRVILNDRREPTKIVAVLKKKGEAGMIKEMFAKDLGCGYGCPTVGVEADTKTGMVTIDRESIYDKEAYDMLIQAMLLCSQLGS